MQVLKFVLGSICDRITQFSQSITATRDTRGKRVFTRFGKRPCRIRSRIIPAGQPLAPLDDDNDDDDARLSDVRLTNARLIVPCATECSLFSYTQTHVYICFSSTFHRITYCTRWRRRRHHASAGRTTAFYSLRSTPDVIRGISKNKSHNNALAIPSNRCPFSLSWMFFFFHSVYVPSIQSARARPRTHVSFLRGFRFKSEIHCARGPDERRLRVGLERRGTPESSVPTISHAKYCQKST